MEENNNENPESIEVIEDDRCPNCKVQKAVIPHTCPYAEEATHDSFTLCHCCHWCKSLCIAAI